MSESKSIALVTPLSIPESYLVGGWMPQRYNAFGNSWRWIPLQPYSGKSEHGVAVKVRYFIYHILPGSFWTLE